METLRFVMTSTFYPPYHLGGDAVHVKYLAEELVKRGHEVHVMFSRDAYRVKRKGEPAAADHGKVQVHSLESPYGKLTPLKVYAFGNSSFILGNYRKLISDVKPDVVHHHNISLLGHRLLRKCGEYRQLYTAHDYWLLCQRSDLMRKGLVCSDFRCKSCATSSGRPPQFWRKKMDTGGIDHIICPSQYMADKLASFGRPLTVIPNFVPPPPEAIADIDNPGYFLYLGVLEPHKGIKELLKAFAGNSQRLMIVGRGSLAGYVEREIESNRLSQRIQYKGWADDKWPLMKGACALVLPSLWPENSPLSVLEAMSVGTPTFCTDMGGTREIVEKVSGKLVIPIQSLATKLDCITPPNKSREEVRKVYLANYAPERYIKKYMNAIGGG